MKKIILGFLVLLSGLAFTVQAGAPFEGTLIALDAGHGGSESGAYNATYNVREADVNLAVVLALRDALEAEGAVVVLTREDDSTLSSRRERVGIALDKCKVTVLARKCDIILSIHHNGNADTGHNGTLVIYNEKQDIPLAKALHDALVPLTGQDEGYLSGGYGITVYGHVVSVLTEAYYITNDSEAMAYTLESEAQIQREVTAQMNGLSAYFTSNPPSGGDGGGSGGGNGKGQGGGKP